MIDFSPGIDPGSWPNSMDALPLAVFLVNRAVCPIYMNQKAHMLIEEHGSETGEPLNGQPLYSLLDLKVTDSNKPYPKDQFPPIMALRGKNTFADDIALRLGGETCFFQVWATPVHLNEDENPCALATFMDISGQKRMESQLKWRNLELQSLIDQVSRGKQELRALSKRLLTVQEEERRHISRELHDEVGQALTLLKIKLQHLPEISDKGGEPSRILAETDLREMTGSIDHTLEQVRNLSANLRPSVLDDLGLVAALRWFVDRQAQLSGIDMRFQTHSDMGRVAPEIETACFRLVQEALTNIIRHSSAKQARVLLEYDEEGIHLSIVDDGKGFNVAKAHENARAGESTGLLGIRERVHLLQGRVVIKSRSNKGTQILAFFPVSPSKGNRMEDGS